MKTYEVYNDETGHSFGLSSLKKTAPPLETKSPSEIAAMLTRKYGVPVTEHIIGRLITPLNIRGNSKYCDSVEVPRKGEGIQAPCVQHRYFKPAWQMIEDAWKTWYTRRHPSLTLVVAS